LIDDDKQQKQMVLNLRPFSLPNDFQAVKTLTRDYDFWRYDRSHKFLSDEAVKRLDSIHSLIFDGMIMSQDKSKSPQTLIYGLSYLFQIDFTNRNAHFNFLCKNEHSRKIFFDLTMKYFFNSYGFHRLYCELEDGDPNYKLFTECGMEICGTKKESRFYGGTYYDTTILSANGSSWVDSKLPLKLLA